MTNIKLETIIAWILIVLAIAIVIWLLIGSPPITNGLLTIIIFIASSVILMLKVLFSLGNRISQITNALDKKTEVSFIKIKNKLSQINQRLDNIENLIKNRK